MKKSLISITLILLAAVCSVTVGSNPAMATQVNYTFSNIPALVDYDSFQNYIPNENFLPTGSYTVVNQALSGSFYLAPLGREAMYSSIITPLSSSLYMNSCGK